MAGLGALGALLRTPALRDSATGHPTHSTPLLPMSMHLSSSEDPTPARRSSFRLPLSAVSCSAAGDLLWSCWGKHTSLVPFLMQGCKWRHFQTILSQGTRESQHQAPIHAAHMKQLPRFFLVLSAQGFSKGVFINWLEKLTSHPGWLSRTQRW